MFNALDPSNHNTTTDGILGAKKRSEAKRYRILHSQYPLRPHTYTRCHR